MAHKIEFHPEFSKLPATAYRAKELGEVFYFTGRRCSKGHLSQRYASSANCAECVATRRGQVKINHKGRSSKRSHENQLLAEAAFNSGHLNYESKDPCPSGHYKRFVSSNNCVECSNIAMKLRAESAKWGRIAKLYGLSKNDIDLMLKNQNYQCFICETDISSKYHVDHCHKSGKVRKLLCQKCNQAIGLFSENSILLDRATKYIEAHRET